jgi:hypothetical protein
MVLVRNRDHKRVPKHAILAARTAFQSQGFHHHPSQGGECGFTRDRIRPFAFLVGRKGLSFVPLFL